MIQQRLNKELRQMQKNPPSNCSLISHSIDTSVHWICLINGPDNTPYQNGKFFIEIQFPDSYPQQPPLVRFITPIFHPNISSDEICLDLLKKNWNSNFTIPLLLSSLQLLLKEPNFYDPLNRDASQAYFRNKKEFQEQAKKFVQIYATNPLFYIN